MRPLLRWLLFLTCLAVFGGAMVWISLKTLDLERQRQHTLEDAQVQEKVRLALWRMDSLASALLIRENSRPAWHYQAFYAPDDLFSNTNNASIPKGQALTPSPLFGNLPDMVQLHFEVPNNGMAVACSPQVPTGAQKDLAMNWYATSPQMSVAATKLLQMDALLKRHPEVKVAPVLGTTLPLDPKEMPKPAEETKNVSQAVGAKKDMEVAIAEGQSASNVIEQNQRASILSRSLTTEKAENYKMPLKKESFAQSPAAKPGAPPASGGFMKNKAAEVAADRFADDLAAAPAPAKSVPAPAPAAAAPAEPAAPAPMLATTTASTGTSASGAAGPAAERARAAGAAAGESSSLDSVAGRYRGNTSLTADASTMTRNESDLTRADRQTLANASLQPASNAPLPGPQRQSLPALAGDLRPVWVEEELLLVRQASVEGVPRLQGVWLDWTLLHQRLLESIHDLLPEATLVALSPALASTDATSLVTLPVKLVTGAVPVTAMVAGSTLRSTLMIAWACLLAAALAIAYVLHRAMLLSERRGAFVSAVTHELRTPLTTFRLYSEMLADDMVPEPEQRKQYLNTLCDESTRLMHLVENVLSYSRIERGRTAARLETVRVQDLVYRIEPRLQQRASMCDLTLKTDVEPAAGDARVQVDALAVEQILFNLTDNACKYAAPDSKPAELHLRVEADGRSLRLIFRDFGPGLSKQALKKLFQPFAKSATEAAHSAPGVGLGLALCRRLADELGGKLERQYCEGRGACFCLTLPRAPSRTGAGAPH